MGKPVGSGGGGNNLFTSNVNGDANVGTTFWIDLGLIPNGKKIFIGNATYTSPDKSVTFEIRSNLASQDSGADGTTLKLISSAVSPRKGTVSFDFYKNGRLHLVSTLSSGNEKWWLKLVSKGATGSVLYSINYTTE